MTELTPITHPLADTLAGPPNRESIAALAYRLWQQRGCPEGSGEQDWLQAEAMLRAESLRQTEATQQAHAAAQFVDAPPVPGKPRAVKAPKVDAARPAAGAAVARKTRVTRARPARPDA